MRWQELALTENPNDRVAAQYMGQVYSYVGRQKTHESRTDCGNIIYYSWDSPYSPRPRVHSMSQRARHVNQRGHLHMNAFAAQPSSSLANNNILVWKNAT